MNKKHIIILILLFLIFVIIYKLLNNNTTIEDFQVNCSGLSQFYCNNTYYPGC